MGLLIQTLDEATVNSIVLFPVGAERVTTFLDGHAQVVCKEHMPTPMACRHAKIKAVARWCLRGLAVP